MRNEKKHETKINPKHEARNSKQIQMPKIQMTKTKSEMRVANYFCFEFGTFVFGICFGFRIFNLFSVFRVFRGLFLTKEVAWRTACMSN